MPWTLALEGEDVRRVLRRGVHESSIEQFRGLSESRQVCGHLIEVFAKNPMWPLPCGRGRLILRVEDREKPVCVWRKDEDVRLKTSKLLASLVAAKETVARVRIPSRVNYFDASERATEQVIDVELPNFSHVDKNAKYVARTPYCRRGWLLSANGPGQFYHFPVAFCDGGVSDGHAGLRCGHGFVSGNVCAELRDKALSTLREPTALVAEVAQFAAEVLKGIDDDASDAMVDVAIARAAHDDLPSCAELLRRQSYLKPATDGLAAVKFIETKCGDAMLGRRQEPCFPKFREELPEPNPRFLVPSFRGEKANTPNSAKPALKLWHPKTWENTESSALVINLSDVAACPPTTIFLIEEDDRLGFLCISA